MTTSFPKNVLKLVVKAIVTALGTYAAATVLQEPLAVALVSMGLFVGAFVLAEKIVGRDLVAKDFPLAKQTIYCLGVCLAAVFFSDALYVALVSGGMSLAVGQIDE